MQNIPLGVSSLRSSRLAYGCWRVAGTWNPDEVTPESRAAGSRAIIAAYEAGYTLFDNADIYCRGEAERILGETLKEVSGMRDRVLIATKGGIRPGGEPNPDAPALRVVACNGVSGKMRVGARRGGERHRDIEREQPLAKIIRLARIAAHEIAQRPLQEQQCDDRQQQPAAAG